MKKRDTWRQANPYDQYIAILNGLRGWLSNCDGSLNDLNRASKADELGEQLLELEPFLRDPSKW
jgi:hypothetical protein